MPESSLSLSFDELKQEVAHYLGYSVNSTVWSAEETADIVACIKKGLRQFYNPPVIGARSHIWSFLHPVGSQTFEADEGEYDLPDNFGSYEGKPTYTDTDCHYPPLEIVGDNEIRKLRTYNTSTGRPTHIAFRNKTVSTTATAGQRFEMMLYPIPDDAYVIDFPYNALASMLTDGSAYPLGGSQHTETILQSCIAAAEKRHNDGETLQHNLFLERLATSISIDARNDPRNLGSNRNESAVYPERGMGDFYLNGEKLF